MSWSQNVYSEMVQAVGWDDTTEELLITFKKNGKTAAYKGYDEEFAQSLANAPSVGQMFIREVRSNANFRYV
jgi:hypothetical protein